MIVVDASVAFKWLKYKDEPYFNQALVLLQEHLYRKSEIVVPDFLFIEIANSLVTKTDTVFRTIQKNLEYLANLNLEVIFTETNDTIKASLWAKQNKTSVYDMLYAVIAERKGIELITADEKFYRKLKFPFVKLLSDIK